MKPPLGQLESLASGRYDIDQVSFWTDADGTHGFGLRLGQGLVSFELVMRDRAPNDWQLWVVDCAAADIDDPYVREAPCIFRCPRIEIDVGASIRVHDGEMRLHQVRFEADAQPQRFHLELGLEARSLVLTESGSWRLALGYETCTAPRFRASFERSRFR